MRSVGASLCPRSYAESERGLKCMYRSFWYGVYFFCSLQQTTFPKLAKYFQSHIFSRALLFVSGEPGSCTGLGWWLDRQTCCCETAKTDRTKGHVFYPVPPLSLRRLALGTEVPATGKPTLAQQRSLPWRGKEAVSQHQLANS